MTSEEIIEYFANQESENESDYEDELCDSEEEE